MKRRVERLSGRGAGESVKGAWHVNDRMTGAVLAGGVWRPKRRQHLVPSSDDLVSSEG
jgi:hypothetical protein